MKKMLLVDDHAMIRQGLITLLQNILESPFRFDEASDGQQAALKVKSCDYDLVLLDISLPGLVAIRPTVPSQKTPIAFLGV